MIIYPTYDEVRYVVANLRDQSRDEIFSCLECSEEDFALDIASSMGFKWVGYYDGKPAAIIGASPQHRGVWNLFGFGTDDWLKIWRDVTKTARKDMMQAVKDTGAHRAQCVTMASHIGTHRWLKALGATLQTPMPAYGREGQDYTMFAWVREKPNVLQAKS